MTNENDVYKETVDFFGLKSVKGYKSYYDKYSFDEKIVDAYVMNEVLESERKLFEKLKVSLLKEYGIVDVEFVTNLTIGLFIVFSVVNTNLEVAISILLTFVMIYPGTGLRDDSKYTFLADDDVTDKMEGLSMEAAQYIYKMIDEFYNSLFLFLFLVGLQLDDGLLAFVLFGVLTVYEFCTKVLLTGHLLSMLYHQKVLIIKPIVSMLHTFAFTPLSFTLFNTSEQVRVAVTIISAVLLVFTVYIDCMKPREDVANGIVVLSKLTKWSCILFAIVKFVFICLMIADIESYRFLSYAELVFGVEAALLLASLIVQGLGMVGLLWNLSLDLSNRLGPTRRCLHTAAVLFYTSCVNNDNPENRLVVIKDIEEFEHENIGRAERNVVLYERLIYNRLVEITARIARRESPGQLVRCRTCLDKVRSGIFKCDQRVEECWRYTFLDDEDFKRPRASIYDYGELFGYHPGLVFNFKFATIGRKVIPIDIKQNLELSGLDPEKLFIHEDFEDGDLVKRFTGNESGAGNQADAFRRMLQELDTGNVGYTTPMQQTNPVQTLFSSPYGQESMLQTEMPGDSGGDRKKTDPGDREEEKESEDGSQMTGKKDDLIDSFFSRKHGSGQQSRYDLS